METTGCRTMPLPNGCEIADSRTNRAIRRFRPPISHDEIIHRQRKSGIRRQARVLARTSKKIVGEVVRGGLRVAGVELQGAFGAGVLAGASGDCQG